MSESRAVCPHCSREPGGRHLDGCVRSRVRQQALAAELEKLGRPRVRWAKGVQIANLTGERVINPGIPYVDPEGGKPWFAGGVPASMRKG